MEVHISSVSLRLTATSMSAAELNLVCIPDDGCSRFSGNPSKDMCFRDTPNHPYSACGSGAPDVHLILEDGPPDELQKHNDCKDLPSGRSLSFDVVSGENQPTTDSSDSDPRVETLNDPPRLPGSPTLQS